jgi:hypothetical protein
MRIAPSAGAIISIPRQTAGISEAKEISVRSFRSRKKYYAKSDGCMGFELDEPPPGKCARTATRCGKR